ncbi:MAG: hypothetical protein ACTSQK_04015 [Candidatus Heimdallarchaeota archaeon]
MSESEKLKQIKEAEEKIEVALWKSVKDGNHEAELKEYREAEAILKGIEGLTEENNKKRKGILAYCMMRIDNVLIELDEPEGAVERTKDALRIAEESEDIVQIARCTLAYGTRLLGDGNIPQAEMQFTRIIKLAEENKENSELQQVLAWAFIIRGHILMGKSLYDQAVHVLDEAIAIGKSIENYAGIAAANRVLINAYNSLGETKKAEEAKQSAEYYQEKAKKEKK